MVVKLSSKAAEGNHSNKVEASLSSKAVVASRNSRAAAVKRRIRVVAASRSNKALAELAKTSNQQANSPGISRAVCFLQRSLWVTRR